MQAKRSNAYLLLQSCYKCPLAAAMQWSSGIMSALLARDPPSSIIVFKASSDSSKVWLSKQDKKTISILQ